MWYPDWDPAPWDLVSLWMHRGLDRRIESWRQNLTDRHGLTLSSEEKVGLDCLSMVPEGLFCWRLGIPFQGYINTFKAGDIDGWVQVRSTSLNPSHRLIVRPNDLDEHLFVHVEFEGRKGGPVGWLYGHEAKQEKWLTDRGNGRDPAYFIPRRHQRLMEEFLELPEVQELIRRLNEEK